MQKGLINLSDSLLLFVYICNLVFKRHPDFASSAFFCCLFFFLFFFLFLSLAGSSSGSVFGFCSVSEALAQTSQPKINSEKHFPPGLLYTTSIKLKPSP